MHIDPGKKIKSIEELKDLLPRIRASGQTIIFANGCFDLIHAGHIRYLQGAKALGDVLILGINSDACVAALKGNGRPLQPETERAEILASMDCVDYVLLFDALTVDGILEELRPDVHAKGTDYTEATVPERQTVQAYGGRIAIVGDPKDHSTRDLIKIILSKFTS
jgi:rfaE bifunctional protein nucleotidyltransferase chain/domain